MKSITILSLVSFLAASPVQLDRRLIDLGAKVNVANLVNANADLSLLDKGKLLRLNTDIGVLANNNGNPSPYPPPGTGFPYPYPPPYPYPFPYPGMFPPQQPR
jgi:hypothetical protein